MSHDSLLYPNIVVTHTHYSGGGFERHSVYKIRVQFLNIDNIHTMRHSLEKLKANCQAYIREEVKQVRRKTVTLNKLTLIF